MEKEINNVLIRISGKIEVSERAKDWQLGDDVVLTIAGGIVKREEKDNQDGTKDIVWVIKPTSVS